MAMLYTTTKDDNTQWHDLLEQAGMFSGIEIESSIRQYLVNTLTAYLQDEDLANRAMHPEQILHLIREGDARQQQLKEMADHCLIISGLYPLLAEKRHTPLSYYIDTGIVSYRHLSSQVNPVQQVFYAQLADEFNNMVNLLYTLRMFAGSEPLSLIQAYELWRDTGNETAYQLLISGRAALPAMNTDWQQH